MAGLVPAISASDALSGNRDPRHKAGDDGHSWNPRIPAFQNTVTAAPRKTLPPSGKIRAPVS
jgi:hypothetical protein